MYIIGRFIKLNFNFLGCKCVFNLRAGSVFLFGSLKSTLYNEMALNIQNKTDFQFL